MSIRESFAAAATSIFNAFGNAVFVGRLIREDQTYVPGQIEIVEQAEEEQGNCRVAFDTKTDTNDTRIMGLELRPTDEKLLIADAKFPPQEGDKVKLLRRQDGTSAADQPIRTIIFVDNAAQLGALYTVVAR
jgi:hypothetical protein